MNKLILICTLLISTISWAKIEITGQEIIDSMHKPMVKSKFIKTQNPEYDFLINMIPHHQGAVDSSQLYLKIGTNAQIRKLAEMIIKDQEKEILDFISLTNEIKNNPIKYTNINLMNFALESEMIMNGMMHKMHIEFSDDIGVDYLSGMIPHHQGAIDASKKILEITKNPEIKKIAEMIIKAQEKEILAFRKILKNIKNN